MKRPGIMLLVVLWLSLLTAHASNDKFFQTESDELSFSDFGTTGLIKTPSSRMAPDGLLNASIVQDEVADVYNITFQATPWLQGTVRYTIFNPDELAQSLDGLRDRSYEAKARLLRESYWRPEVAVGVRDLLGTGAWEAEYLVGSKQIGAFDVSLGLGWGRLAEAGGFANPLGVLADKFKTRPSTGEGVENGGQFRSRSWFRGDVGLFGGVYYRPPSSKFSALLEYNSDAYNREAALKSVDSPSPMNLAIVWKPVTNLSLKLAWLRGDTLGFSLASTIDAAGRPQRRRGKAFYSGAETQKRSLAPEGIDRTSWYDVMLYDLERSGLRLNRARRTNDSNVARLEIENVEYALTADAIHRALTFSEAHMPAGITKVDLMLMENGHNAATISYQLQRAPAGKIVVPKLRVPQNVLGQTLTVLPPRQVSEPTNVTDYGYPHLAFGADFGVKVQLMDPDDPLRSQLYAKLTARLSLSKHWNLWARYDQDISNDFSEARESDSRIERVRSEVNRYLVEGESGLDQLYVEYRASLYPDVHARGYAGILESMYVGVGGEVLYSPWRNRWALGASINAVRQRGFERDFKLRDYTTVSGHMSLYYATPWYNVDAALHAGRYLARDRGYTVEARRTFDSGFSLGAFFTRTNVSADDFGEGSFDKGLFFRFPFNGLLPGNTRAAYTTTLRPLERDGGRRLDGFSGTLWFDQRAVRYDALDGNKDRMLP